jgi:hypothetical protein|tara:strand:- start:397 stop:615 length:219 start_codon:yes stop_codon:yes gene_type:complete
MTIKEDKLINEVYNKARDLIEKEKINPIDFSGALLNVAKLILIEEVGTKDAEILFDFANKSFIIETEQITYH